MVVRIGGRRSTGSKIEFGEDVAEMARDSLLADVEPVRDRPVGDARGD